MTSRWLVLPLLIASACTEWYESPVASHDLEADAVAPGVGATFRASWRKTEVVHDSSSDCNTCDPPPDTPSSRDILASVTFGCTGVGCVIDDDDGRRCVALDGSGTVGARCATPAVVTAADEGALAITLDLASDDGGSIRMPFTLDVIEPTALAIARCGVDYEETTCLYRDDDGAVGVELRVDGLRDDRRIAIDQAATAAGATIHCNRRRCLLVADPRVATTVVASFGALTVAADLGFPAELPDTLPLWR